MVVTFAMNRDRSEAIRHSITGPAVVHEDGTKEWWVDGIRLNCQSQEEFERYLKQKAFW
jgi:hypothetical protein